MHKTLYIDIDEEITSIVDRIRREGAPDVFLVVPKNALLVQGIINLKILKRETERLAKNVMLVANDKYARKVIERAGLVITNKPLEDSEPVQDKKKRIQHQEVENALEELVDLGTDQQQIGSASFYDAEPLAAEAVDLAPGISNLEQSSKSHQPKIEPKAEASLSVRAPLLPKSHGSLDLRKSISQPVFAREKEVDRKKMLSELPALELPDFAPALSREKKEERAAKQKMFGQNKDKKAKKTEFWDSKKAEEFFSAPSFAEEMPKQVAKPKDTSSLKAKIVLMLLVLILLSGGAWGYWSYPKVSVIIYPISATKKFSLDLRAISNKNASELKEKEILAKYYELEVSKTLEFEASGEKAASDDGKAKGKVTILNKFSSSTQPLIATTRILSQEGKLFRLVNAVTVPGMKGDQPGKIEAEVIADKAGEDFNIGPSKFTVEGFKGTPKYEKFEVSSTAAMGNGGSAQEVKKVRVVLAKDLELARQQTLEELEKNLEIEVAAKIESGQKVLGEAMEKDITQNAASLKEGAVADKFSYTITEKVKVLTFAKEDLEQAIQQRASEGKESGYELEFFGDLAYEKIVPDFQKKELGLQVSSQLRLSAQIDTENIKKGIVEKTQTEIKQILATYPELEKAEIKFSPAWLGKVPSAERKIEVKIAQESPEGPF